MDIILYFVFGTISGIIACYYCHKLECEAYNRGLSIYYNKDIR